jgi:hypothetical protein
MPLGELGIIYVEDTQGRPITGARASSRKRAQPAAHGVDQLPAVLGRERRPPAVQIVELVSRPGSSDRAHIRRP